MLFKVSVIQIILHAFNSSTYRELAHDNINSVQKAYLLQFWPARIFLTALEFHHDASFYNYKQLSCNKLSMTFGHIFGLLKSWSRLVWKEGWTPKVTWIFKVEWRNTADCEKNEFRVKQFQIDLRNEITRTKHLI